MRAGTAALLALALSACDGPDVGTPEADPGAAAPPASVKGTLRVSVYGEEAADSGQAPFRHVSVYANGPDYRGMEDNDLRGFLDGRFMYAWNQPGQGHVRAGRRKMHARYGEVELFRSIQRWEGVALPPRAHVHRASLTLHVERGPKRPLRFFLYAVKPDWDPGRGGARGNNTDPPEPGDVWWRERAHGEAAWGLPGVGYASDQDPDADTEAMPLAEVRWARPQTTLVFESEALAAYAQRRARRRLPLLFLVKLEDYVEDEPYTLFKIWSGNAGEERNPARRPTLRLEWESPDELARLERGIHLEHGRTLELPSLPGSGPRIVAASFETEEGHEPPRIEVHDPAAGRWRLAVAPLALDGAATRVRVVAARDPVLLGQPFRSAIRDSWIRTAPPEEQRVPWTFVSPRGEVRVVESRYAGDYRWEVEFEPGELGRWRYFYETDFERPQRSADGFFDVVAGDRAHVQQELRALLARIRAASPASREEAVATFGVPFWRLERAAMRLETPESFRAAPGRETFALISEVRAALSLREQVPDEPRIRPMKRAF